MKICPICRQNFKDVDTYCPVDGSTLVDGKDNSSQFSRSDAPTQYISSPLESDAPSVTRIPGWLFLVLGLMGTALVGLVVVVFIFLNNAGDFTSNTPQNTRETQRALGAEAGGTNESREVYGINSVERAESNVQREKVRFPPPVGHWAGDWKSKSTSFTATASFEVVNNNVEGQINWKLIQTTNPKKIAKIGSLATEYVRGTFDPKSGKVHLKGFRKDDPADIVILDRYTLFVSNNGQLLKGKSINGTFLLRR